jgi:hypothetical protein
MDAHHIDYSPHILEMQRLLKKVHEECTSKNFDSAYESCLSLITEGRLLRSSITLNQEQIRRSIK